jgi:hypothetical protein
MVRVRFAGVPEEQPAASEEVWGSDYEEEEQDQTHQQHAAPASSQAQQWRHQHQQHARLGPTVLSQLPSTSARQQQTTATNFSAAHIAGTGQYSGAGAVSAAAKRAAMQQLLQQQRQQGAEQQQQQLPSLQQLCVGVLGRHVTELVQQLDGQLGWLPADVKAALLAVARWAQPQHVCTGGQILCIVVCQLPVLAGLEVAVVCLLLFAFVEVQRSHMHNMHRYCY